MKWSFLFPLLAFVLLAPLPATAQESIRVLDASVDAAFPQAVTFRLRAQGPAPIVKAEVRFATERRTCAPVETSGFAAIIPSREIAVSWTWDLRRGGSLPPGAVLRYRWLLWDAEGRSLETPWETRAVEDTRHPWDHVSQGMTTLAWYQGEEGFARALLDSAAQAAARMEAIAGVRPSAPVTFYIYATSEHLRDALVFPTEWTGGVAFNDFNIVAIGIGPTDLAWGLRAVAHEMTHILLDQATFNCLGHLPTWLNEGLATYNEDAAGEPQPAYASALQEGLRTGRLFSVSGLSQGFPTSTGDALLAYGQSHSLASYLVKAYGPGPMQAALEAIRRGAGADEALLAAYGFDQEGLDARWRASIGAPPREEGAPVRLPLPTPVLPEFEPFSLPTPGATPTHLLPSPTATVAVVATPAATESPSPTPTLPPAPRSGGCNGGLPPVRR